MSNLYQPEIHLRQARLAGDVFEFRPQGGPGCHAGQQHDPYALDKIQSSGGTWHICRACDAAWFVPR